VPRYRLQLFYVQQNYTALLGACNAGRHIAVAEKLIQNGANINIRFSGSLKDAAVSKSGKACYSPDIMPSHSIFSREI
jgi:ankyrin repeat protein